MLLIVIKLKNTSVFYYFVVCKKGAFIKRRIFHVLCTSGTPGCYPGETIGKNVVPIGKSFHQDGRHSSALELAPFAQLTSCPACPNY